MRNSSCLDKWSRKKEGKKEVNELKKEGKNEIRKESLPCIIAHAGAVQCGGRGFWIFKKFFGGHFQMDRGVCVEYITDVDCLHALEAGGGRAVAEHSRGFWVGYDNYTYRTLTSGCPVW